ncbi:bli-3 [Cordylochernes scorpioides]|uniref:Bli-3 n=1 Tax=Cordylochernes scorpioides TaxID=51811 RepID=A0ABY6L4I4_9ARAC|nr:bli-3 [Cordylochernes scorpioides]
MKSFQLNHPPREEHPSWLRQRWNHLETFLEEYRQHIFYLFVFFVITFVLFLERFIFYMYFSEHMDLRHVMGMGIAITRGSAASLSFCYSVLLLTMCRNLITKLRELPLHQYVPLDSHVQFHKIVAMTSLFFTLVHTVGHCSNFFHISKQPLENLRCLTKEMHFESDFRPTAFFWFFQTITGLTGLLLYVLVCVLFIFAHPWVRQKAYSYFWTTHSLYILIYVLCLVHGLAKLTGSPRFWMFFVGPAIIYTLDKVVSLQTKYMELEILETELLPSDVTRVKFVRPPNFKYLSGQWVRMACTAFRPREFHSLSLTSAPHHNYLSVHVKAQGPWTWKLRNYLDPNNNKPWPKLRLEGPYGGGNQEWYKYEVAIMVGGGIGVTPYASILNDLVFGTSTNRYSGVACKKVYFLWICPSHRHFEWFIDVLRDVERRDVTNVLEIHIFITQFFHKFDLRTTMLYICENHFQRISNCSLFTGLKAVNHFGRPDMTAFLKFVQQQHSYNKRRRLINSNKHANGKPGDKYDKATPTSYTDVKEWLHQNHKRCVKVKIGPDASISTLSRKGEVLRKLDFTTVHALVVEVTKDNNRKPMILVRSPRDHDLVLQFDSLATRKKFLNKLEAFLGAHKKVLDVLHTYKEAMLANAETKEKRQRRLERFFREAYALAFGLKPSERRKMDESNGGDVIMVMRTSLSKAEFAEALGMKTDSLFVKQMFNCVDKDKDGRISFQEFLDTVDLFSRGKPENKLRIIFDMCDAEGRGTIEKQELTRILRSLVDIAKTASLSEDQVQALIGDMFSAAGLQDKERLSYEDFTLLMQEYKGDLIGLDCKGVKQNFLDTSSNITRMKSFQLNHPPREEHPSWLRQRWNHLETFLEEYRQHIFYLFVFFVITFVLFLERFIFYMYFSEHMDLRHVMGMGIAITRGSAASLSFCYSVLLLTMCRNLITKLRELPLHQYVPLDSHVQFHKIVAMTSLFFTLVHTVGHCSNFFHISKQPLENLRCLTKEMHFESDFRPTAFFWFFQTITGLTGLLLYVLVCVLFIFAHPWVRQKAYSYFWTTHSLYILIYVLCLVHGLAKLTGSPRFWMFFVGPAIIYTLDKVVSLQTKYMELEILETELLPSDVTRVKFVRPPNFKYLSGQWVRMACTAFRPREFHSLSLTSAPHHNYLSVHVKAQGPWTWKLRNYLDPNNNKPWPKLRLEGPYGGGNQEWYKYEVAIMVGGGIGVTPYASILNDLVFGTSTNRYSGVACKKVYFLWICPSHRHFEWFIDVLRDVERRDVTNVLEIHIFITQFFHKFDLRTTMLYICENHFQRISNCSLFTGLKAVNHFGRPDMTAFLKFVQQQHSYVSKVGVFSCGPVTMTKSVTAACETVNNKRKLPYFIHQFENF